MLVNEPADDLECERHPPSAVGDTPPKRFGGRLKQVQNGSSGWAQQRSEEG